MTDHVPTTARERRTSIDDLDTIGAELCEQRLRLATGGKGKPGFVLTIGTNVGPVPLDVSLDW
jgi:hypothetical protein